MDFHANLAQPTHTLKAVNSEIFHPIPFIMYVNHFIYLYGPHWCDCKHCKPTAGPPSEISVGLLLGKESGLKDDNGKRQGKRGKR